MSSMITIDKPQKIDLRDIDPSDTGKTSKEDAAACLQSQHLEMDELQEILYAAQMTGVLIVLQGMDTSGKDGTISHVMSAVNPQGCNVAAFKVPTPLEASHDFLWRVHPHAPAKGMISIFNRSHYEDVLVTRVHGIIDKKTCEIRYDHIRHWESLIADSGTLILKFLLHISKDEQEKRLLAREDDSDKAWKLSMADWKERDLWSGYVDAYEDAIGATGAAHAPWHIVPADHKWYRNYIIAKTIIDVLQPHKDEWTKSLKALGKQRKQELAEFREQRAAGGKGVLESGRKGK